MRPGVPRSAASRARPRSTASRRATFHRGVRRACEARSAASSRIFSRRRGTTTRNVGRSCANAASRSSRRGTCAMRMPRAMQMSCRPRARMWASGRAITVRPPSWTISEYVPATASTVPRRFRWVTRAPRGSPVVPEVCTIVAGSSGEARRRRRSISAGSTSAPSTTRCCRSVGPASIVRTGSPARPPDRAAASSISASAAVPPTARLARASRSCAPAWTGAEVG